MSGREIVQNLKFKNANDGFDHNALAKLIEESYLQQRRAPKFSKKTTFSPSSIGGYQGTCPRYWYLAFEGGIAVDAADAVGIATMKNGTDAGVRIAKVFEDSGALVGKEIEVNLKDPPIRGFIDVMVRLDGEIVVGEIKTTRQESFVFRKNTMKPMATHLCQILIYLDATQKKHGFLMYENRNTQEYVIIPVEMNEKNRKILDEVYDWLRVVRKSWEDKELPKRPFQKRNKICKGCPMFDICWNHSPDGTVKIPVMVTPVP